MDVNCYIYMKCINFLYDINNDLAFVMPELLFPGSTYL